jgi:hypothetical protein
MNLPSSGESGNPITYQADGTPKISAANDVTGDSGDWADQGSNVWRQNVGANTATMVIFDGTQLGVKDATPDAQYEWTYSNPNLDVYSVGNPTSYYTTIEKSQRNNGIDLNDQDYITIRDIEFYGEKFYSIRGVASSGNTISNITLKDCIFWEGGQSATSFRSVYFHGGDESTRRVSNITVTDCQFTGSQGSFVAYYVDDLTVTGIDITATDNTGMITINLSDTVTVAGCTAAGSQFQGTDNLLIDNNQLIGTADHGVNIEMGGASADVLNITIENNTIKNQLWAAIWPGGTDPYKIDGLIIRYNWMEDCGNTGDGETGGIKLWRGHRNVEIYSNVLINCSWIGDLKSNTAGIEINPIASTVGIDGVEIYNNTLYDNYQAQIRVLDASGGGVHPKNITVKNNILYADGEYTLTVGSSTAAVASNVYDYNHYYQAGSAEMVDWGGTDYDKTEWGSFRAASNQEPNSPNPADPQFVDASNDDYKLSAGSPCINAGTDVGLVRDYAGDLVPIEKVDIGAYEYQIKTIGAGQKKVYRISLEIEGFVTIESENGDST